MGRRVGLTQQSVCNCWGWASAEWPYPETWHGNSTQLWAWGGAGETDVLMETTRPSCLGVHWEAAFGSLLGLTLCLCLCLGTFMAIWIYFRNWKPFFGEIMLCFISLKIPQLTCFPIMESSSLRIFFWLKIDKFLDKNISRVNLWVSQAAFVSIPCMILTKIQVPFTLETLN